MIGSLIQFIFPDCCYVCGNVLTEQEKYICVTCLSELPRIYTGELFNHPVYRKLRGRLSPQSVYTYMQFVKNGISQVVLHEIKYHGSPDFARYMGQVAGKSMREELLQSGIEALIPVPIHSAKLKKRGYNQAEEIARGISEITGIEVNTEILIKRKATQSQTRLSRWVRWVNQQEIFTCEIQVDYKHILLVDDVITTGATTESCINALLRNNSLTYSLLFLASADD